MSVSGPSSGGMYVISGLMPSTTYSIQVAAETSAGTGPYSEPVNIETPESECALCHNLRTHATHKSLSLDIYLSLKDNIIPNHGYVVISDIGTDDDTALLCHTNRPADSGAMDNPHSDGDCMVCTRWD